MRLNNDEKLIFEDHEEKFDNHLYLEYNNEKLILNRRNIVYSGETFTDLESLYNRLKE